MKITIYTDGACKGNPGRGGWGALLMSGQHVKEIYGGEHETTNNRMELMAAIKALEALIGHGHTVDLWADSQYVVRGCNEWLASWKSKGWRTSSGPLKNKDLWVRMDSLLAVHNVTCLWTKGHADDPYNNRADELANMGVATL